MHQFVLPGRGEAQVLAPVNSWTLLPMLWWVVVVVVVVVVWYHILYQTGVW